MVVPMITVARIAFQGASWPTYASPQNPKKDIITQILLSVVFDKGGSFLENKDVSVRKKFFYFGIGWLVTGLLILIIDYLLRLRWFAFEMGGVWVSLGWFIILLALLNLYQHWEIQRSLRLTPEEISQYLTKFEEASGDILRMLSEGVKAKDIAEKVQKSHGIPRLVTLKFLIALGDAWRKGP